jgi:hypothetical protein
MMMIMMITLVELKERETEEISANLSTTRLTWSCSE